MTAVQDSGVFLNVLSTQLFGYFSAAATAGRLLQLSAAQLESAFGLASMQAAGTTELVINSTDSVGKCIYAAFSNQGGVQAALLAQRGVKAAGACFEGQAGLIRIYFGGHCSRSVLVDGLGTTFRSSVRLFKAWPASAITHPFIEAALELRSMYGLEPADLASVQLHVGTWGKAFCEPLEARRRPTAGATAKNSVPFTVAKALANGAVTLDDFEDEGRGQKIALEIADKITYEFEPELSRPKGLEPGIVEVRTGTGASYSARVDHALGHPTRPLGFEGLARKFRETTGSSRRDRCRPLAEDSRGSESETFLHNPKVAGRFVHLSHLALIAWPDRRGPCLRAGGPEQGGPRQREGDRTTRSGQHSLLGAIAGNWDPTGLFGKLHRARVSAAEPPRCERH